MDGLEGAVGKGTAFIGNAAKRGAVLAVFSLRFTILVLLAVTVGSGLSYLGIGKSVAYYALTAPFNVSIEDNIAGNVGIFITIVACFELYLRATRRDLQAFYGFVSIICTCYFIQDLFALVGGFPITGTSGIGSAMMVSLGIIIFRDLEERAEATSKSHSLAQWLLFPLIFLVVFCVLVYLLLLYLGFFIIGNGSAIPHIIAAAASIFVFFNVTNVMGANIWKTNTGGRKTAPISLGNAIGDLMGRSMAGPRPAGANFLIALLVWMGLATVAVGWYFGFGPSGTANYGAQETIAYGLVTILFAWGALRGIKVVWYLLLLWGIVGVASIVWFDIIGMITGLAIMRFASEEDVKIYFRIA